MAKPEIALVPQSRDATGRFQKGQSGNPGGRPKGLVRAIREHTEDGEQLVGFMLRVFRGEVPEAKLRERTDATWRAIRVAVGDRKWPTI